MTILCFSRDKLIAKLIYKTLPCSLTWRQIPHFGDIKTVPKMLQFIFLIQAESNSLICWVASEFSRDALHCVSRELKRQGLHHKLISEKEVKWWNNITIVTFLGVLSLFEILNSDSHFHSSRNNGIIARSGGTHLSSWNWKDEVGELLWDRHKLRLHHESNKDGLRTETHPTPIKQTEMAGDRAARVKALAANPENLSSIPET